MRYRALSDVRVVDLTHFIAGPYATKLLADMGADVVKVEPPWGEGGRRLGPNRASDEERGGLFAFLNLNKWGVTLNLKHERGRELLAGLLDGADLLIENFAPGTLAAHGLAPDELIARFPKLSVVSISNFGQDGPERDGKLNDLVLFARGGWTFPVGERESRAADAAGLARAIRRRAVWRRLPRCRRLRRATWDSATGSRSTCRFSRRPSPR